MLSRRAALALLGSSVAAARIQHPTTIVEKLTDPNRIVVETMPDGDLTGIDFLIGGERVQIPPVNAADRTVLVAENQIGGLLRGLRPDTGAAWLEQLNAAGLSGQARAEAIPVELWRKLMV